MMNCVSRASKGRVEASELSSGDSLSHGPLLTSVSSSRFSVPEREGLKPAGYRDSDSRRQEERNIGNMAQDVIAPRKEGEFSFPGSTLWFQSAEGKKRRNYCYIFKWTGKTALGERTRMTRENLGLLHA